MEFGEWGMSRSASYVCPLTCALSETLPKRDAFTANRLRLTQCPPGFVDGGKFGCYATQTSHAQYECSAFSHRDGGRCATFSYPLSRCTGTPDGKGKCLMSTTEFTVWYGKKH
eukprot:GHVN01054534.1.p2 GENE.GHVN01054534.1~~GHVN01054534.1.p2  ORF type:complete len:113 (+),score=7.34 GHVN01054534.1:614-952(+)